jgi:hypothetical protein
MFCFSSAAKLPCPTVTALVVALAPRVPRKSPSVYHFNASATTHLPTIMGYVVMRLPHRSAPIAPHNNLFAHWHGYSGIPALEKCYTLHTPVATGFQGKYLNRKMVR